MSKPWLEADQHGCARRLEQAIRARAAAMDYLKPSAQTPTRGVKHNDLECQVGTIAQVDVLGIGTVNAWRNDQGWFGLQGEGRYPDFMVTAVRPLRLVPQDAVVTECKTPEGETAGLIDGAIFALRIASRGDLNAPLVRAAIEDLLSDPEINRILTVENTLGETK